MLLPVDAKSAEVVEVQGGGYAIRFHDYNGYEQLLPAEDMVILRKYYSENEMFGAGNQRCAPHESVAHLATGLCFPVMQGIRAHWLL